MVYIPHSLIYAEISLFVAIKLTTFNGILLSLTNFGKVDSNLIAWKREAGKCSGVDMDAITIAAISSTVVLTIAGLEEDSSYAITVTATSVTGKTVNSSLKAMTMIAGEILKWVN